MAESLEQRVSLLEAEVAQLKSAIKNGSRAEISTTEPWWKKRAGAFANEPLYDEAMRLGREYRESLHSKESVHE